MSENGGTKEPTPTPASSTAEEEDNANAASSSTSAPTTDTDFGPSVHVSDHPILSHKISVLRSSSTQPSSFRAVLREITFHLGYEATKTDIEVKEVPLSVPIPRKKKGGGSNGKGEGVELDHVDVVGSKITSRTSLIPILRSGLGMVDPMLQLLPDAGVHHIGMYRRDGIPVQYYNRLPRKCESDVSYVLDPVMATGSTILSVVGMLKKWGVPKIHVLSVIASRPGLAKLVKSHPDVSVTVGTVDDELAEDGTVLPGLGDAGDRLFGTPLMVDGEDEMLLHPSKRRKMSDA